MPNLVVPNGIFEVPPKVLQLEDGLAVSEDPLLLGSGSVRLRLFLLPLLLWLLQGNLGRQWSCRKSPGRHRQTCRTRRLR